MMNLFVILCLATVAAWSLSLVMIDYHEGLALFFTKSAAQWRDMQYIQGAEEEAVVRYRQHEKRCLAVAETHYKKALTWKLGS